MCVNYINFLFYTYLSLCPILLVLQHIYLSISLSIYLSVCICCLQQLLSNDCLWSNSIEMPKTGKPDAYWVGVMALYAQGKHKFTTGQRPECRRWRAVIERINSCPLTPVFGQTVRYTDIFGNEIHCKCGYHKVIDVIKSLNL